MEKKARNNFDFIRDATRIVEENEAMKGFFKDRLAELDSVDRNILSIIEKHQPLRNSTSAVIRGRSVNFQDRKRL